jgi:hypothetical protein
MNRMIPLPLSRTVLDWAAHKAGGTLQSFAESIAKRGSDRARIAGGHLTVPQAEKLARKASIPFGHLFLEQPPDRARPTIPDLRQAQGAWPLSADFYETLEDVRAKQDWLIEFRRESGRMSCRSWAASLAMPGALPRVSRWTSAVNWISATMTAVGVRMPLPTSPG